MTRTLADLKPGDAVAVTDRELLARIKRERAAHKRMMSPQLRSDLFEAALNDYDDARTSLDSYLYAMLDAADGVGEPAGPPDRAAIARQVRKDAVAHIKRELPGLLEMVMEPFE